MKSHIYDIRLTASEAVVLFELLQRIDDERPLDLAEQEVVNSLLTLLEGALTERVDHGYAGALARAKQLTESRAKQLTESRAKQTLVSAGR